MSQSESLEHSLRVESSSLSTFQLDILGILADESRHGLGIKAKLEEIRAEEIYHSRLYTNLDELVDAGLLEKRELDKRTNEYSLTKRGSNLLTARHRWMHHQLKRGEQ